jgi:hypothetical protein
VGPSAFDAGVSDQDGVSSVGDLGERDVNASTVSSRSSTTKKNAVFAYVQSNDLHHYKPPVLMYDPALEDVAPTARDKSRSIFNSFGYFNRGALSPSPHRLSDVGDAYVPVVKVGDNVRTFYGEGRVKAVRATDAIVEVKMWNWTARCYLREEDVEVVEKPEKVRRSERSKTERGGGKRSETSEAKRSDAKPRSSTAYGSRPAPLLYCVSLASPLVCCISLASPLLHCVSLATPLLLCV